jgi:membrane fusion protein (multidrug efflux system)
LNRRRSEFYMLFIGISTLSGCGGQTEQRTVDLTVPVTVQAVRLDTMEATVGATGTLRSSKEARIQTEVEGILRFVARDGGERPAEGMRVTRNQEIARLVNRELEVNARVESRALAKSAAKRTLREQEVLVERKLGTERDLDEARRALAEAESNYEDALVQIAKTTIRTPIAGFLTGLADITDGTLVEARTTIATVMDYSRVLVELKIPNAYISSVSPGQIVRMENYALPNRLFRGTIKVVDPAIDPTTRTFRVVGAVKNPDLMLRPGMFVKAEIVTESHENVVVIPRRFVLTRQNRKVVFVEEEGRAQMRNVEFGLEGSEQVEILEGLEPGERLITSNYETLRPRTRVRVTGEGVPGQR